MHEATFLSAQDDSRIFAIANAATVDSNLDVGVVFCHAFAEERQKTYRATHHFSNMLGEHGIPSLRFDYFGTGDSDGGMEGITLDRMLADSMVAAAHARETLERESLIFLGIRLGAVIAARAASALSGANACIMWNPVIDGGAYLRSLRRTQKLIRLSRLKDSPPSIKPPYDTSLAVIEADLMTADLASQIGSINLNSESIDIDHLFVTGRKDDQKEQAAIGAFLESKQSDVRTVEAYLEQPREYWSTRSMYDAYFPLETFEATLRWVHEYANGRLNGRDTEVH